MMIIIFHSNYVYLNWAIFTLPEPKTQVSFRHPLAYLSIYFLYFESYGYGV
jgi:hypothetical protein